MTLNLNGYVKFRPTEIGWKTLEEAETLLATQERSSDMAQKTPYYYNNKPDGTVTMLFWKLLQVFGKNMELKTKPFSEGNTIEDVEL